MAQESHRPYPVDELLAAVRLEIAAELRSDGKDNQKVPLSKGRRTSSAEGRYEYLFQCHKWQDGLDGKPVLVRPSRSTGDWAQAEAKRLPGGSVRLATAMDLGNAPSNVQIREDDAAGWRTLAERLEAVGQPEHPVRVESAGWMVGRGSPRLGSERSMARWVANWASLQLNDAFRPVQWNGLVDSRQAHCPAVRSAVTPEPIPALHHPRVPSASPASPSRSSTRRCRPCPG
jgi:hypothetical protein